MDTPVYKRLIAGSSVDCSPVSKRIIAKLKTEIDDLKEQRDIEKSIKHSDAEVQTQIDFETQSLEDASKLLNDARNTTRSVYEEKMGIEEEFKKFKVTVTDEKRDLSLKLFRMQQELDRKNLEISCLKEVKKDAEYKEEMLKKSFDLRIQELTSSLDQVRGLEPVTKSDSSADEGVRNLEEKIRLLETRLSEEESKFMAISNELSLLNEEQQIIRNLLEVQTQRADLLSQSYLDSLNDFSELSSYVSDILTERTSYETEVGCDLCVDMTKDVYLDFDFTWLKEYEDYVCAFNVSMTDPSDQKELMFAVNDSIHGLCSFFKNELDSIYSAGKDSEVHLTNCETIGLDDIRDIISRLQLQLKDKCFELNEIVAQLTDVSRQHKETLSENIQLNAQIASYVLEITAMKDEINCRANERAVLSVINESPEVSLESNDRETELQCDEFVNTEDQFKVEVVDSMDLVKSESDETKALKCENLSMHWNDSHREMKDESLSFQTFVSANTSIQNASSLGIAIGNIHSTSNHHTDVINTFAKEFSDHLVVNQVFHPDDVPPNDLHVFYFLLDRYLELVEAFHSARDEILVLERQNHETNIKTEAFMSRIESQLDVSEENLTTSSLDFDSKLPSSTICEQSVNYSLSTTLVGDATRDPLELTRDVLATPKTPATAQRSLVTPLRNILRRDPCSSVKKTVTFQSPFQSPLLARASALAAENERLKTLLEQTENNCTVIKNLFDAKVLEITKLTDRVLRLEESSMEFAAELEKSEAEHSEVRQRLKDDLAQQMSSLQAIRSKLINETMNMDPSLEDALKDTSNEELVSIFVATIIAKCQKLQQQQKEQHAKDLGEWSSEVLQLKTENQAQAEIERQLKFDLSELKAILQTVTTEKSDLEQKNAQMEQLIKDAEDVRMRLESRLQEASTSMSALEDRVSEGSNKLTEQIEKNSMLEQDITLHLKTIECLDLSLKESLANNEMLQDGINALNLEKESLLKDFTGKSCNTESEMTLLRETNQSLGTEIKTLSLKVEEMTSQISELTCNNDELRKKLETINFEKQSINTVLADLGAEKDKTVEAQSVLQNKIDSMEMENNDLLSKIEKLTFENDSLFERVKLMEATAILLEETKSEKEAVLKEIEIAHVENQKITKALEDSCFEKEESLKLCRVMEGKMEKLTMDYNSLQLQVSALCSEKKELDLQIVELTEKCRQSNETNELNDVSMKNLVAENERLQSEINAAKNDAEALLASSTTEKDALRSQVCELSLQKKELVLRIDELTEKCKLLSESNDDSLKNLFSENEKLRSEIDAVKAEKDKAEAQLASLKTEIDGLQLQLSESSLQKKELNHQIEQLTEKLRLSIETSETNDLSMKNLITENEMLRSGLDALKSAKEATESLLASSTVEKDTASKELSLLTGKVTELTEKIGKMESLIAESTSENAKLISCNESMKSEANLLEKIKFALESKLATVEAELVRTESQCSSLTETKIALEDKANALSNKVEELLAKNDELEKKVSSLMSDIESKNTAVEGEQSQLTEEMENIRASLNAAAEKLETQRKLLEEKTNLMIELTTEKDAALVSFKEKDVEIERLTEQLREKDERLIELEQMISEQDAAEMQEIADILKAEDSLKEKDSLLLKLEMELSDANKVIAKFESLGKQYAELQDIVKMMKNEMIDLQGQLTNKNTEIAAKDDILNKKYCTLLKAESERDDAIRQLDEVVGLKEEVKKLSLQIKQRDESLIHLGSRIEEATQFLNSLLASSMDELQCKSYGIHCDFAGEFSNCSDDTKALVNLTKNLFTTIDQMLTFVTGKIKTLTVKQTEIQRVELENDQLNVEIKELKERLINATEDKKALNVKLDSVSEEKTNLEKNFIETKSQFEAVDTARLLESDKNKILTEKLESLTDAMQLNAAQVSLLNVEIQEKVQMCSNLNLDNNKMKERLNDADHRINELKETIDRYRSTEKAILLKLEDKQKSDETVIKLTAEVESLNCELKTLQSDATKYKDMASQNGAMNDEISALKGRLAQLAQEKFLLQEKFSNEKAHFGEKLSKESECVVQLREKNSSLSKMLRQLEDKVKKLDAKLLDVEKEVVGLRNEKGTLTLEKDALTLEVANLNLVNQNFKTKTNDLEAFGRRQENQIAELRSRVSSLAPVADRRGRRSGEHISSRRLDRLEELNKALHDLVTQLLTTLHMPNLSKFNLISVRGIESAVKPIMDFATKLAESETTIESLKEQMKTLDEENQELSDNVEALLKAVNELELKNIQQSGPPLACDACPESTKSIQERDSIISELRAVIKTNELKIATITETTKELSEKCNLLEESRENLRAQLSDKEQQLLKMVNSSELRLCGSRTSGFAQELDQKDKIRSLTKSNEMLKGLLRESTQRVKDLESKTAKPLSPMNCNLLDSPRRKRSYNLRTRSDVAAAYKNAVRIKSDGIENL